MVMCGGGVSRSFCSFLLLGLLALWGCGSSTGSGVTGTNTEYGVQLNWSEVDSPDPAVSYNVYRQGTEGFNQINTSPVTSASYLDTAVASGETYGYEVTAVDAVGGESAPSSPITVSVP